MRTLLLLIFASALLSCSEEIIYIDDPIVSKVDIYFDKAQYLKYPKGLKDYIEDNPKLYVYPHINYSKITAPQAIVSIINRKKAFMGEYQEKFIVKEWWTNHDRILVTDYNANLSNTVVFNTNEINSSSVSNNYLQLTKNDTITYYLPVRESKTISNYYLSVSEVVWQSHDKYEGEINSYYDKVYWKSTSDSIIIQEKNYRKTVLSISRKDKSGTIKMQFRDTLQVFTWDSLGHGTYYTKHLETGKSNKAKLTW